MAVRRVGILGGTFDPPHMGHLILAEEARDQLNLDMVLFVPAGDPPHKRDRRLAPAEHRVAMVSLAIADNPAFFLSRVDVDRPGPHYTVDMVRLIRAQYPPPVKLYFLMGFDSQADLPNWHKPEELVAMCHLVALTRFDVALDWNYLESRLPGIRKRVRILDMPELEIASHVIQARVRAHRTIRYQVPPAVEAYIYKHRLYLETTKEVEPHAGEGPSP